MLIRIGSAFGVDAVMFGPGCSDPFSRRVLRVSMANGLFLTVIESVDPCSDLQRLKSEHNIELIASVLDEDATPLDSFVRPQRFAILFGHETNGLDPALIAMCDRRVTVPMRNHTDSLNVAVSSRILLYEFTHG